MKRLMIINWRWKEFKKNSSENIDLVNNEKCLYISNYDNDNAENFNKFIEKVIKSENPIEALILSHNNPATSTISISLEKINLISKENFLMKKREFKGGQEFIYNGDDDCGMIDTNTNLESYEKQLKVENFDKVWDWYWNKLDLENHKKNIINLWLPLAIDIQGLSEVKNNDEKANEYFAEIKEEKEYLNSLLSFPKEEDFPRWKEIIEELRKDKTKKNYADFNPSTLVEVIKKDQSDFNSLMNNELKYLEKENNKSLNPNFLPNWLQEVVTIINKKINESA